MANVTERPAGEATVGDAPTGWGSRLKLVGPGLVVAATGVGAGDMVSSLTAGTEFGTVLIWAVILGVSLLIFLYVGAQELIGALGE